MSTRTPSCYSDPGWDEPREPEKTCERCEAPVSWCYCYPIVLCPQCGAEHEDMDGFGVLHCSDCGFCTHASQDEYPDGRIVCGLCGRISHAA